jgi:hypothetical protein
MDMKLALAKDLAVPVDVVTEALAWIGARGSGKTHGAGKLVELFAEAGVPFVVIDPVGVWYGIRLARDGKSPGLKVPVFGGLHGDLPLEPTAGALIADLIVDKNLSCILDISQFDTDADKARFCAAFAERLFALHKKHPSPRHVIVDEAQEVVPQNPQPGEQQMLHRWHRKVKLGRNFGLGVSLLTQRPQEVSKKVLNQCQTVLAFRLTGPQERKAMAEWVSAHGLGQDLVDKLPHLETGNCHVWSPAFLKVSKEVRILPKETFDASATPKFGEKRAARELAPIDLANLKEAMAATVEKAKENDPVALKRELADLRKRFITAQGAVAKVIDTVEVPIVLAKDLRAVETLLARLERLVTSSKEVAGELASPLQQVAAALQRASSPARPVPMPVRHAPPGAARPVAMPRLNAAAHPKLVAASAAHGGLTGPQMKILAALAFLETLGVNQPSKVQVALFTGSSPSSSTYANNLGALRSKGLIDYPNGGAELTEAGRELAPREGAPTSTAELHAIVLGMVTGPQRAILDVLFQVYPAAQTKEDLAAALGVSATSSTFANNLGALRTMGALTYPKPGVVAAASIMFIDRASV